MWDTASKAWAVPERMQDGASLSSHQQPPRTITAARWESPGVDLSRGCCNPSCVPWGCAWSWPSHGAAGCPPNPIPMLGVPRCGRRELSVTASLMDGHRAGAGSGTETGAGAGLACQQLSGQTRKGGVQCKHFQFRNHYVLKNNPIK